MNHKPYFLHGAWWVMVGGRIFGAWRDKGAALAGYETERRRAARHSTASSTVTL